MNILKKFFLLLFFFPAMNSYAQSGCTDYQATNYDHLADTNDGSCIYPFTSLPLTFKCYIDSTELYETSGIVKHDNNYWTHVDNTNNSIYRIDTLSDSIFQQVSINNSTNYDWEDITSDSLYIYMGDVGNNDGNRTNLRFYKVLKSDITSVSTAVNAGRINFSYSDQVDFTVNHNNNYYDCEAFFCRNDSIHLFTKGWANRWTKHYVLPADTGIQIALLVDSFNVGSLITSAAIQGDSLVVLLGLNFSGGNNCQVWMLNNFTGSRFFSGNKRKFSIGSFFSAGQAEGICFSDTNKGYITNERNQLGNTIIPARLREFDLNPYLAPVPQVPVIATSVDSIYQILKACNDTGSVTMTIRNVSPVIGQDLNFSISGLPVWLTAVPASDTIVAGDSTVITLNFISGLWPAGTYNANISIQSNDIYHPVKNVEVMLTVDSNPCMVFNTSTSICTGQTIFTSFGLNNPTSYYWDFGDGDTSNAINPIHTYALDGNYIVTLVGCNSTGCDTTSSTVNVHISGLMAPVCQTVTQSHCCGIGIRSFHFDGPFGGGFGYTTQNASVGYEDFTCMFTNSLMTNYPYGLRCTTGTSQPEYLKIWLDLNNDGVFDTQSEELFSDLNTVPPYHNGTVTIPSLPGNVYGVPIRLRLASDFQQMPQPCLNPVYGQHEDYTIILNFSVDVNEITNETGLKIFPNPFTHSTSIDYSLHQSSNVRLEVFNLLGEKVAVLVDGQKQSSGQYHFLFSEQPAGIYFARLSVNDFTVVEKIVKAD